MATALKHDAVTQLLWDQVQNGIAEIQAGNDILLADESGTSVRDIDKVLKSEAEKVSKGETSDLPADVLSSFSEAQSAYEIYRKNVEAARNAYRTQVLGEEASTSEGDVDKDALKEKRKVVLDAVQFLESYAKGNGRNDILNALHELQIPQVGRQGVSSVGVKKPRVFVKIGDKTYGSFSETAAALSTADSKVTAGELATAWHEAGGQEGEFKFGDSVLNVTFKPKKSDG